MLERVMSAFMGGLLFASLALLVRGLFHAGLLLVYATSGRKCTVVIGDIKDRNYRDEGKEAVYTYDATVRLKNEEIHTTYEQTEKSSAIVELPKGTVLKARYNRDSGAINETGSLAKKTLIELAIPVGILLLTVGIPLIFG